MRNKFQSVPLVKIGNEFNFKLAPQHPQTRFALDQRAGYFLAHQTGSCNSRESLQAARLRRKSTCEGNLQVNGGESPILPSGYDNKPSPLQPNLGRGWLNDSEATERVGMNCQEWVSLSGRGTALAHLPHRLLMNLEP